MYFYLLILQKKIVDFPGFCDDFILHAIAVSQSEFKIA